MSEQPACVLGTENRKDIESLRRDLTQGQKEHEEIWEAINGIRNRLPAWATLAISLLTFLCGVLLTLAVKR